MLTARVPESSLTSTASSRGVLDISSIFFFMYSFSLAFWKYFDLAILSTNFKIRLPVLPPAAALREAKLIFHQMALIYFKQHFWQRTQKRQRLCFIGIIHPKIMSLQTLFAGTQKGTFSKMSKLLFSTHWKWMVTVVVSSPHPLSLYGQEAGFTFSEISQYIACSVEERPVWNDMRVRKCNFRVNYPYNVSKPLDYILMFNLQRAFLRYIPLK